MGINSKPTYLNGNYNNVNRRGATTNCSSAETKFLRTNFEDFCFVERVVEQRLIQQDKNFQEGTENFFKRLLSEEKPRFRKKKKKKELAEAVGKHYS
jgi:hypothetical protein